MPVAFADWFKGGARKDQSTGSADSATPRQHSPEPTQCTVLGVVVPLTTDTDEFARTVLTTRAPAGLLLAMEDVTAAYGHLLNSDSKAREYFYMSASDGPSRLVCAGCEEVLPDSVAFRMGSDSAAAAMGGRHHSACPVCGSTNGVIAYMPADSS